MKKVVGLLILFMVFTWVSIVFRDTDHYKNAKGSYVSPDKAACDFLNTLPIERAREAKMSSGGSYVLIIYRVEPGDRIK